MVLAGAIIAAVTAPWDLRDHAHVYKVSWIPFLSGIIRPIDLLANFALYLPLGYFFPSDGYRRRIVFAAVTGLLLSASMETAQVWSHVRFPSATDLVMNVAGCIAGAIVSGRRRQRELAPPSRTASRGALSA